MIQWVNEYNMFETRYVWASIMLLWGSDLASLVWQMLQNCKGMSHKNLMSNFWADVHFKESFWFNYAKNESLQTVLLTSFAKANLGQTLHQFPLRCFSMWRISGPSPLGPLFRMSHWRIYLAKSLLLGTAGVGMGKKG